MKTYLKNKNILSFVNHSEIYLMDKSYQDQLFFGYQAPNGLELSLMPSTSSSASSSSSSNNNNNNPFSSLYQTNSMQSFDQVQKKPNTFSDILSHQNKVPLAFDYSALSCLRTPTTPYIANLSETNELFNAAAAAAYNAVSVSFAGKLASEF